MTHRVAALVAALVVGGSGAPPAQPPAQACGAAALLIRDVDVWTPNGLLPERDVLIRDGRIVTMAATGTIAADGVETLDGRNHSLLPGLIDTHLHFVVPGGLAARGGPAREASAITGRQLLRSGVTAGRLHLAPLEEAARLKARGAGACHPMPRLQVGGPGFGGAATADQPQFWRVASADEAEAKVKRVADAGLDWLAVHEAHRFAPGVLDAIVASARRHGVRVMGAGTRTEDLRAVLAVNPDTLDYVDTTVEAYGGDVLQMIAARRDLTLAPTVGIHERRRAYLASPPLVEAPANFTFFQPAEQAFAVATARADLAKDPAVLDAPRIFTALRTTLRQLRATGTPLAIASDTGSPVHFQGDAIWWELEAWRRLGVPHRAVLMAATAGGARVLRGLDVGRLEPGAIADFVLYRGHAERGPFEARRVRAVGKAGVLHVRDGQWIEHTPAFALGLRRAPPTP